MDEALIGTLLYFARGDTFLKVIETLPEEPELGSGSRRMKTVDLANGAMSEAHFIEEIGSEYILVPGDYPQSRIDAFLAAAKQRDEAAQIMLDITQEILLSTE